jgi:hypothetical protein
MSDQTYSVQAGAAGTATARISPTKSGIQWAIAQISIECIPSRTTQQVTVRKNGNYYTSSAVLPSVASGTPAMLLQANDMVTADFIGCTAGDSCIVTISYNESPWGTVPRVDVV